MLDLCQLGWGFLLHIAPLWSHDLSAHSAVLFTVSNVTCLSPEGPFLKPRSAPVSAVQDKVGVAREVREKLSSRCRLP
jgi:hypothetical protein